MDTLATPTPGVGRSSDAGSSSVSSAVKGDLKRAATFKQRKRLPFSLPAKLREAFDGETHAALH